METHDPYALLDHRIIVRTIKKKKELIKVNEKVPWNFVYKFQTNVFPNLASLVSHTPWNHSLLLWLLEVFYYRLWQRSSVCVCTYSYIHIMYICYTYIRIITYICIMYILYMYTSHISHSYNIYYICTYICIYKYIYYMYINSPCLLGWVPRGRWQVPHLPLISVTSTA